MFEKDYDSVLIKYRVSRYHSPDDVKKLTNLFNQLSRKSHSNISWNNSYSLGGRSFNKSFITSTDQVCTVKMNYSNSMEAHRKFYDTYMTQKNKRNVLQKPELFGNQTLDKYKKTVQSSKYQQPYFINRVTKNKMPYSRHYKFVLSPEKQLSAELLKTYTKMFVERLEQTLGFKVDWQAAAHTDTEHNHVHLLVNGVNKNGEQFTIPKKFITEDGRKISSEILTAMCGEREEELIRSARERRVTAQRLTEFDQIILRKMSKSENEKYLGKLPFCLDGEIGKRLQFLRQLGVIDYEPGYYLIKKDMESTLKALGRYNKFLEAKKFCRTEKPMALYTSDLGKVQGKVKHIYSMNDEDVWTNAIVIESENKAYFIPLYNPLDKNLKLDGKEIIFESKKNAQGKLNPDFRIVGNKDDPKINKQSVSGYEKVQDENEPEYD